MKVVLSVVVTQAVVIGVGLVSAAFGQTTVEFGITAPGTTGNNLSGVYTDPYQGYIEAVGGTPGQGGTAVAAFCDDFTDDVSPPQYWTAFDTNLSQFPGTNNVPVNSVYYGDYNGPGNLLTAAQQTTDYIAVAILAVESMHNTGNAAVQNQLSFALWDVFDSGVLSSDCNAYGCLDAGANGSTLDTQSGTPNWYAATQDVNAAIALAKTYSSGATYESASGYNVQIYTPETPGSGVDPYGDTTRPQEFITVTAVPEAPPLLESAVYFLFAGGCLLFFGRRRIFNRTAVSRV